MRANILYVASISWWNEHGLLMDIVTLLTITSFADMMPAIAVQEIVSIQQHMHVLNLVEHVQHVLIVILQIMPLVDSAQVMELVKEKTVKIQPIHALITMWPVI